MDLAEISAALKAAGCTFDNGYSDHLPVLVKIDRR